MEVNYDTRPQTKEEAERLCSNPVQYLASHLLPAAGFEPRGALVSPNGIFLGDHYSRNGLIANLCGRGEVMFSYYVANRGNSSQPGIQQDYRDFGTSTKEAITTLVRTGIYYGAGPAGEDRRAERQRIHTQILSAYHAELFRNM